MSHKAIQVLISYHGVDDSVCSNAFELHVHDLHAVTRYLSRQRISDVELYACVPMKKLHDSCKRVCQEIKELE